MNVIELFRRSNNLHGSIYFVNAAIFSISKNPFLKINNIKSSKFLLKNLKEFTHIMRITNFSIKKTSKQTAKIFYYIQKMFFPNQLIVINTDFQSFILIIQHCFEIIKYMNKAKNSNFNIIWIPEDNNVISFNDFYENEKSLKELLQQFNIYILNWIISIDNVVNKLTNFDLEDELYFSKYKTNRICFSKFEMYFSSFCNQFIKLNELGKYLILKFDYFIFNKNDKYSTKNFLNLSSENWISERKNFIYKIKNYEPVIQNSFDSFEWNDKIIDKATEKNELKRVSYRVALPAHMEPFIITSENSFKDLNENECVDGMPCLKLKYHENFYNILTINGKEDFIKKYENMVNREETKMLIRKLSSRKKGNRKCCSGFIVNILQRLSQDLDVDFDLYISPNDMFGKYDNSTKSWNGLMNHILNDVTDIIAGPFSLTEERAHFIDYTTIFLSSGNSLLIKQDYNTYDLFMFMKPFTYIHWFLILVCSLISAIALALLEFNSPFGLNPKGRQRARNYTLGSAISMVTSLMFMHTMPAKSPKSWPGKFV